jgi:hypothetical protein
MGGVMGNSNSWNILNAYDGSGQTTPPSPPPLPFAPVDYRPPAFRLAGNNLLQLIPVPTAQPQPMGATDLGSTPPMQNPAVAQMGNFAPPVSSRSAPVSLLDRVQNAIVSARQSSQDYLNRPDVSSILDSTVEAGRRAQEMGDKTAIASATAAILGAPTLNPVWEALAAAGVSVGATTDVIGRGMQGAGSYLQGWRDHSAAPMIKAAPNILRPGIESDME